MEPGDLEGWIQLGNTQHNFALQLRDQGKYDNSKQMLQEAIDTLLGVECRFGSNKNLGLELASAQASLGLEEASHGNWLQSKSLLNSSVDRLRGLVADNAEDRGPASLLGWCLFNYAIALSTHGEGDEANMRFSDAIEILKFLSQKYPSIAQYRQDFSSTLISFSKHLLSQKKYSDAMLHVEKALSIVESFLATTPNSRDFLWVQGDALRTIAEIHLDQHQIELASQKFQSALDSWLQIEKNRKGSAELYTSNHEQFQMAAAFASGLVVNRSDEYWSVAMDLWNRQFPIDHDIDNRVTRFAQLIYSRTQGFLKRNAVDEAMSSLSAFEQLETMETDSPNARYTFACIHGMIALALQPSDARITQHLSTAVRHLRLAVENGWSDRTRTLQDPDLVLILNDRDVKSFVESISISEKSQR